MDYDFQIDEKTLARFKELLKTDKLTNLEERWNYFANTDPESTQKLLGFVPMIVNNYWVVIPVIDPEGQITHAYSVGIEYEYSHPEILIVGGNLQQHEYAGIINEAGNFIANGGQIKIGHDYTKELLEKEELKSEDRNGTLEFVEGGEKFMLVKTDKPIVFEELSDEMKNTYNLNKIRTFYKNFADTTDCRVICCQL